MKFWGAWAFSVTFMIGFLSYLGTDTQQRVLELEKRAAMTDFKIRHLEEMSGQPRNLELPEKPIHSAISDIRIAQFRKTFDVEIPVTKRWLEGDANGGVLVYTTPQTCMYFHFYRARTDWNIPVSTSMTVIPRKQLDDGCL